MLVRLLPRTRLSLEPRVITALSNVQHPTLSSHRVVGGVFSDELVCHRDSFANTPIAFFRMSRSCRMISNSRRKRLFSEAKSPSLVPALLISLGLCAASQWYN